MTGIAAPHSRTKLCLYVAAAYLITGYLGLKAPSFGNNITLLWLPTGIAVAALMRLGYGVFPGIWTGAFLVNLLIGTGTVPAACIAVFNTLAPLLTAWLLNRSRFNTAFSHRRDVILLIGFAATGMLISASGGVGTLWLDDLIPSTVVTEAWYVWWLGDTVGVLIAAPFMLTLTQRNYQQLAERPTEVAIFFPLLIAVSWLVFLSPWGKHNIAFLSIPFILWAGLRFGITGASMTVMTVSAIAAWGTATDRGPFSLSHTSEALLLLWAYITTLIAISLILTALLAESRKIAAELRLHSLILQNMSEGVQLTRAHDSIIVYTNPNFEEMFGYGPGELLGQHVSKLNAQSSKSPLEVAAEIDAELHLHGHWSGEILNARKDGREIWCRVAISKFDHPDLGLLWVAVHADITQQKQTEEQVHFLAFYDALTELPNRRLLLERLKHHIEEGKRSDAHLGLIFIDLDYFKQLNDSLGHDAGDALLIEVAARLRKCVREGDTVARLGGDEFVVLVPNLSNNIATATEDAHRIAETIRASVEQPYSLGGAPHVCTSSIGVDISRQGEIDLRSSMKRADAAMYEAKARGRNSICLSYSENECPIRDDGN